MNAVLGTAFSFVALAPDNSAPMLRVGFCRSRCHGCSHGEKSAPCRAARTRSGTAAPTKRRRWPPNSASPRPPPSPISPRPLDAVVICVSADADVRSVIEGMAPGLAHGHAGHRLLHGQRRYRALGGELSAPTRGALFSTRPVSGGVEGAQKATLAIMCGGDAGGLRRRRSRCSRAMGKTIEHFGPAGAGQATKATNQIMCAGIIRACAEAMAFAGAHQLPLERVVSHARRRRRLELVLRASRAEHGARQLPGGIPRQAACQGSRHLPRHGGALRRVAAGGRFDARRIRAAHRPGLSATRTSPRRTGSSRRCSRTPRPE